MSAGGHFDPGPSGNMDPDANHPFHMGDLPNLKVGADGKGELDATTTRVTLTDGPLSLLDADGSAIIIHGNPDQGITGEPKSGLSGGPRVACGVISAEALSTSSQGRYDFNSRESRPAFFGSASSPVPPFNTSTRGANGRA